MCMCAIYAHFPSNVSVYHAQFHVCMLLPSMVHYSSLMIMPVIMVRCYLIIK